jgi:hypothetical protein
LGALRGDGLPLDLVLGDAVIKGVRKIDS